MDDIFYQTTFEVPFGTLTLAAKENKLVGTWLEGQKYFASFLNGCRVAERDDLKIFRDTKLWLSDYFNGVERYPNELPLSFIGSEFRQIVWGELCKIPYGSIVSYGEIATRVAKIMGKDKMSFQAVGGAIGHNPILIIVPCHRVLGKSGSLTGYAAGLEVKSKLLKLEKVKIN